MKLRQDIVAILNEPMDRQDFLKSIAIGVVALTGFGAALRVLGPTNKPANKLGAVSKGYGGSAYGGDKEGV